jgi:hypothetical protein
MQRSTRQVAIDTFRAVPVNPVARNARQYLLDAFSIASDEMMRADYFHTEHGLSIMERLTELWGEAHETHETLDVVSFRARALAILTEG